MSSDSSGQTRCRSRASGCSRSSPDICFCWVWYPWSLRDHSKHLPRRCLHAALMASLCTEQLSHGASRSSTLHIQCCRLWTPWYRSHDVLSPRVRPCSSRSCISWRKVGLPSSFWSPWANLESRCWTHPIFVKIIEWFILRSWWLRPNFFHAGIVIFFSFLGFIFRD